MGKPILPTASLITTTSQNLSSNRKKMKVANLVEVMGWKAVGSKLLDFTKSTELQWEQKPGNKKQTELF